MKRESVEYLLEIFRSADNVSSWRAKRKCTAIVIWMFWVICVLGLLSPGVKSYLDISVLTAWYILLLAFFYAAIRTYVVFKIDPTTTLVDLSFFIFDFLCFSIAIFTTGGEKSPFILSFLISIVTAGLYFGLAGTLAVSIFTVGFIIEISFLSHLIFRRPFNLWTVLFESSFTLGAGLIASILAESEARERKLRIASQHSLVNLLSGREKHILTLLLEGKSNKEIATVIKRDEKTVRNQLTSLYRKLGIKSRYELQMLKTPLVNPVDFIPEETLKPSAD